jgi:hypothetical protein
VRAGYLLGEKQREERGTCREMREELDVERGEKGSFWGKMGEKRKELFVERGERNFL